MVLPYPYQTNIDLNESISGSESTESTTSSTSQDPLSKLLAKHNITSTTLMPSKVNKSRSPLIWFTSELLPQPTSLGIYRAMFDEEDGQEDPVALLRYQQIHTSKPRKRTIALMMIGGGHFAAIIASLTPKIVKNHQSQEERQVEVLASKTFHRYTTRRKQGGAQSANDASRGNAISAGSSLRRYNEAALQKEVRELLASWKAELEQCEFIFIRATGSANRKTLFGYEGTLLKSNDSRIRGFPFTTRRPVYSFVMILRVDKKRAVTML
jgi:Bacteroidetes VLRF1 release factor